MQRIIFEQTWEDFFSQAGLREFDDFFHHPVTKDMFKKRQVASFTIGSGAAAKTFFIKRFCYPHLKDIMAAKLKFGKFYSQAACEWQSAKLLFGSGIETYRPVGFGEQKIFGLEMRSFFVTEKLEGKCMAELVTKRWGQMSEVQKEELITQLGQFVGRIHKADFNLPDLYLWHFFVTGQRTEGGKNLYDFAVIDLHRMEAKVRNKRKQLKSLGRLYHSMKEKYFDERMRRLVIESYVGEFGDMDIETVMDGAVKYSRKLSARRKAKPYSIFVTAE